MLFSASHTDLCYGYAAFRRHKILELGLTAAGFEIATQLFLRAIRNGLSVVEVPSFESPRRSGPSNLHPFRDGWRVLPTTFRPRLADGTSAPWLGRVGPHEGREACPGDPP